VTLPKTVRIAGIPIKIVRQDLDGDPYGYWSHDKRTIVLDVNLRGKKLRDTLRHEMLHAVLDLSGVSFSEGPKYPDESTIRAIETLFFPAWDRMQKRLSQS
jgi:Zn-dependent peptidase ImmA (M78 family)